MSGSTIFFQEAKFLLFSKQFSKGNLSLGELVEFGRMLNERRKRDMKDHGEDGTPEEIQERCVDAARCMNFIVMNLQTEDERLRQIVDQLQATFGHPSKEYNRSWLDVCQVAGISPLALRFLVKERADELVVQLNDCDNAQLALDHPCMRYCIRRTVNRIGTPSSRCINP